MLLLLTLLLPAAQLDSKATDCLPGESPCTTTMSETGVDLMVASTVSVALESRVNLDIIPKTNGAFTETTSKLTIATNNPSGYAVYMQAGKVVDNKASLISTDLSNNATISPVEGRVSSSSFLANTWGYSLDGENYQAVPATTSKIQETATTTFNDIYDLSFGVKVDTNLPAGQYYNSVIVSAVANPINITSLNQLTYMQDMTSDICTNTAENVTKQLIDTRDGKSYWVAKLKDGNCWMTQNLAYTITQEMIDNNSINSTNTDVTGTWNSGSTNPPKPTEGNESLYAVDEYQRSWSFGKYVIATPKVYGYCVTDTRIMSFNLGTDWMKTCAEVGLVDVSSDGWKPSFTAQEKTISNPDYVRKTVELSGSLAGTNVALYIPRQEAVSREADKDENGNYIPYEYTGLVALDPENKTYDAHYLIGNYYQWSTAVAGDADVAVNEKAASSICPKGWELPTTVKGNDNKPIEPDGSFFKLFRSLGYQLSSIWVDSYKNPLLGYTQNNHVAQYPMGTPLHYVRSGSVSLTDDVMTVSIGNGTLLSGSKNASTSGYGGGNSLLLQANNMSVAYVWSGSARAASVRCLAK